MFRSWYREFDFYDYRTDNYPPHDPVTNSVYFRNEIPGSMVMQLTVTRYKKGNTIVRAAFSPFCGEELASACRKFFLENEFDFSTRKFDSERGVIDIAFTIHSISAINRLIELFKYLNELYNRIDFPADVVNEFQQIAAYLIADVHDQQFRHIIPKKIYVSNCPNPARAQSEKLFDLIAYNLKNGFSLRDLIYLLIQGEDTNQHGCSKGGFGTTPLYEAVSRHDSVPAVKLLLMYGADPFYRDNGEFYISPVELAKSLRRYDLVDLFMSRYMRVEKSLPDTKPNLKVRNTRIAAIRYKSIATEFEFTNARSIHTKLMHTQDLSGEQHSELISMFAKKFQAADNRKITEIFQEAVGKFNNIVELIYSENQLIGFNLFELIKQEEELYLHCIYSFVEQEYRGYRIMSLLAFRLAFALQMLNPEQAVGIIFSAIHYNSYRMIKDLLHFPKFQPDHVNGKIFNLIIKIFKESSSFHHDLLMCYLDEDTMVKEAASNHTADLGEEFFYQHLLNMQDAKTSARGAPVLFYVGDDSFRKLQFAMAASGINFADHLGHLANALGIYQGATPGAAPGIISFSQSSHLFWFNKKLPAYLTVNKASAAPRPKL